MNRIKRRKRMGLLTTGMLLVPALLLGGCGGGNGGQITGNITNTGGNGGPGATGSFTVTFGPTNTSNANVSAFTPTIFQGVFRLAGSLRTLDAGFNGAAGTGDRTFIVSIQKPSPFAANDIFSVNASGNTRATVSYIENVDYMVREWVGNSGTARITAINGRAVTLELTNVVMQPNNGVGPTSTGQFTIATATGSVTAQQDLS